MIYEPYSIYVPAQRSLWRNGKIDLQAQDEFCENMFFFGQNTIIKQAQVHSYILLFIFKQFVFSNVIRKKIESICAADRMSYDEKKKYSGKKWNVTCDSTDISRKSAISIIFGCPIPIAKGLFQTK